jgi:hypothetical protein
MDLNPKEKIIVDFLNNAGIHCEKIGDLDGLQLDRDALLDTGNYEKARGNIPQLKKLFSSSYLTSLQSSASKTQRWPLINLIRQILKSSEHSLTPKRLCYGYTAGGVKKYRRIFIIEKRKIPSPKDTDEPQPHLQAQT